MTIPYQASGGYIGGTVFTVSPALVRQAQVDAAPIEALRSVLLGTNGWQLQLDEAQRVELRVHFIDFASTAVGQNVQSLTLNGQLYVKNLDCFALTGQAGTEVVRNIRVDAPAGLFTFGLTASVGQTSIAAHELRKTSLAVSTILDPDVVGEDAEVPTDGWIREFWPNTNNFTTSSPTVTETKTGLATNDAWGNSPPYAGFPVAPWVMRQRGKFTFSGAQQTFVATVDDGLRVFDNDVQVDPGTWWGQTDPIIRTFNWTPSAGVHEIRVEYSNLAFTGVLSVNWHPTATPPPPPPPPSPGSLLMAVFLGGGSPFAHAAYWESLVDYQQPLGMWSTNWDTRGPADYIFDGGLTSWLRGDPNRRAIIGCNWMEDGPGDFYMSSTRTQMAGFGSLIHGLALDGQVVVRPGYEANADYWFPWMPRNYGNNFQGYKDVWRESKQAFRDTGCTSPWAYCCVPWDDNFAEMDAMYPGSDSLGADYCTFDVYDRDAYDATQAGRLQTHLNRLMTGVNFAAAKGKPWGIDESNLWQPGVAGSDGDNPDWIRMIFDTCITYGAQWWVYFNVAHDITFHLEDAPDAKAAYIQRWSTVP